jgi:hypothetical protein
VINRRAPVTDIGKHLGQLQQHHRGQQRAFVGMQVRPRLLEACDGRLRVKAGGSHPTDTQ